MTEITYLNSCDSTPGSSAQALREGAGELFKVGLDGYQHNYQISSRAGSPELHDIIRRGPWTIARGLTHNVEPRQAFPYLQEMIRHHERILSDAMQSSRPDDFDSMDKGFGNFFRFLRWQWGLDTNPTPEPASLYAALDREHRIVLMGLAARAATLENIGRISDMSPYALPARRAFSNPGTLADDLAYAIQSRERSTSFSQWTEWDRQDSGQETGLISVSPEKYPFTFFAIRMMEIVTDPKPTINLHGESQRTLDWFTNNSERLERHVAEGPGITIQRRRELVVETLEEAVINDSIQEDLNIIGWNLSEERMSDFTFRGVLRRGRHERNRKTVRTRGIPSIPRGRQWRFSRGTRDPQPRAKGFSCRNTTGNSAWVHSSRKETDMEPTFRTT